jgi:hypothetical protein
MLRVSYNLNGQKLYHLHDNRHMLLWNYTVSSPILSKTSTYFRTFVRGVVACAGVGRRLPFRAIIGLWHLFYPHLRPARL